MLKIFFIFLYSIIILSLFSCSVNTTTRVYNKDGKCIMKIIEAPCYFKVYDENGKLINKYDEVNKTNKEVKNEQGN